MSAALQLRFAVPGDCAGLTVLAQESKSAWPYPGEQLAAWRGELTVAPQSLSTAPAWVAEDDAGIVGFFQVVPPPPQWQLEHCWVRPAAMRKGIGRAMMLHALQLVGAAGGNGLAIDADPHAEAFYLALGACRVGAVAAPLEGDPGRVRPQLWLATRA
jgi:GNAT superfamily N-acetyltransferase